MNPIEEVNELLSFINSSPNIFYAVDNIEKKLIANNFKLLLENEKWHLQPHSKYYIKSNNSSIIAFKTGSQNIENEGIKIIAAHGDSPCFKIKPKHILESNGYIKLNTEAYGGVIVAPWLDRSLSISGRIALKNRHSIAPKELLININEPLFIIPNIAIHLNREINNGHKYNKQIDLLPIAGFVNEQLEHNDYLLTEISRRYNINISDILDFDLFLYPYEKGELMGFQKDLFSSARLDDQWMVYNGFEALLRCENKGTQMCVCYDAEEIGSMTTDGGQSSLLKNTIERICIGLSKNKEEFYITLNNSFLVSADLAHGLHPNLPEKSDPTNRPVLGKGIVIKYSASQKYATTAVTASIFKNICESAEVNYQVFANHSEMLSGSTIGPLNAAQLPIKTIDVGTPILSMHSPRETAAVSDHIGCLKAFIKYYEI